MSNLVVETIRWRLFYRSFPWWQKNQVRKLPKLAKLLSINNFGITMRLLAKQSFQLSQIGQSGSQRALLPLAGEVTKTAMKDYLCKSPCPLPQTIAVRFKHIEN